MGDGNTKTKGLFGGFFFFFFSSLLIQFLSLITHHSLLKIPQFPIPTRWHTSLNFSSLKFFYFFVGSIPVNWSIPSIKPTRGNHSPPFSLFSFSLHPFTPVILSLFTLHSLPLSLQAQPSSPPSARAHKLTSRSRREHR